MPFYDYRCEACATRFEELVREADQLVRCPACAAPQVTRMPAAFAVGKGRPAARSLTPSAAPGGCGTCGDPRGPGACKL
ncbi:MAG: FmdB family zinc ribbon protein [Planctomycetota bacterium]